VYGGSNDRPNQAKLETMSPELIGQLEEIYGRLSDIVGVDIANMVYKEYVQGNVYLPQMEGLIKVTTIIASDSNGYDARSFFLSTLLDNYTSTKGLSRTISESFELCNEHLQLEEKTFLELSERYGSPKSQITNEPIYSELGVTVQELKEQQSDIIKRQQIRLEINEHIGGDIDNPRDLHRIEHRLRMDRNALRFDKGNVELQMKVTELELAVAKHSSESLEGFGEKFTGELVPDILTDLASQGQIDPVSVASAITKAVAYKLGASELELSRIQSTFTVADIIQAVTTGNVIGATKAVTDVVQILITEYSKDVRTRGEQLEQSRADIETKISEIEASHIKQSADLEVQIQAGTATAQDIEKFQANMQELWSAAEVQSSTTQLSDQFLSQAQATIEAKLTLLNDQVSILKDSLATHQAQGEFENKLGIYHKDREVTLTQIEQGVGAYTKSITDLQSSKSQFEAEIKRLQNAGLVFRRNTQLSKLQEALDQCTARLNEHQGILDELQNIKSQVESCVGTVENVEVASLNLTSIESIIAEANILTKEQYDSRLAEGGDFIISQDGISYRADVKFNSQVEAENYITQITGFNINNVDWRSTDPQNFDGLYLVECEGVYGDENSFTLIELKSCQKFKISWHDGGHTDLVTDKNSTMSHFNLSYTVGNKGNRKTINQHLNY
jgi:hypothetical protein